MRQSTYRMLYDMYLAIYGNDITFDEFVVKEEERRTKILEGARLSINQQSF